MEEDTPRRRRQIAEAVWRLAASGGLEAVTLRVVAAEAGLPTRAIQYHFGTRAQLLLGALELLNADAEEEARRRVAALGPDPQPRELVRAVLLELLPLDDARRTRHRIYAAYFIRFLSDPELRPVAEAAQPALGDLVTGLLAGAHARGETGPGTEPGRDGQLLVAVAEGLQSQMLLEEVGPDTAIALLDHQLERVLPAPG